MKPHSKLFPDSGLLADNMSPHISLAALGAVKSIIPLLSTRHSVPGYIEGQEEEQMFSETGRIAYSADFLDLLIFGLARERVLERLV